MNRKIIVEKKHGIAKLVLNRPQALNALDEELLSELVAALDDIEKDDGVGVVILTLLASLAENKTQGIIFRAGMWIYAAYIFVFQVLYRMGNLYYSHSLVVRESGEQLLPFADALGAKKIQELTLSLEERKRYFRCMYWITSGLYMFVVFLIIVAGFLLPSVIAQLGGADTTPTLTPIPISTEPTATRSPPPPLTPAASGTALSPAMTLAPQSMAIPRSVRRDRVFCSHRVSAGAVGEDSVRWVDQPISETAYRLRGLNEVQNAIVEELA